MGRFWGTDKRGEAADWQSRATTLQQRLERADESALFKQAEFDANDLVLKMALEALKKADPNSPLLDKSNRDKMRRRHIAGVLGAKGYKFDVTTGQVLSRPR
jgi:hypothetical protein